MSYSVTCREAGYDCEFMVQSATEKETMKMTKMHAKESHGMDLSDDDIKGLIKHT